jgi:hypothetical protein
MRRKTRRAGDQKQRDRRNWNVLVEAGVLTFGCVNQDYISTS